MRASATAKLLKWGCSTQSMSHNGFGIDRSFPSLTPNANKPHSTAELQSKNGYVNMGEAIAQITHAHARRELNVENSTSTYLYRTCTHKLSAYVLLCTWMFIKCWNELGFAVGFRIKLRCGVAGRFLGMIGRLRPVERPIWPHFYSDCSADRFSAAESHRGWSHTHTYTHV